MTLQELVNQRFQNTVYVHPNANIVFTPRNVDIYNKSLEIVKIIFELYLKYPLALLHELFGSLSFLLMPDPNINLRKELNEVEELVSFFQRILDKNNELYNIIINTNSVICVQNISINNFQLYVKEKIYELAYKTLKRLEQMQESKKIPIHYNVFIQVDYNYIYRIFEEALHSPYHYYKILIEFQNLELASNCEIKLNDRITIKWLSDLDWYSFNYREISIFDTFKGNIDNPVVEISFKACKDKGYNLQTDSEGVKGTFIHSENLLDNYIYDILSVLRLFSCKYIGFKRVFSTSPNINATYFEHFLSYLYSNTLVRTKEKYALDDKNKSELITLFTKFMTSQKDKSIALAIRRFNSTYERRENEDKLIDYFIAVETLLHIDGIRKHNKLSMALAELLGSNNEEKRDIRKKITKYYNLRNDIIHKSNSNRREETFEAIQYMDLMTRKLLIKSLR